MIWGRTIRLAGQVKIKENYLVDGNPKISESQKGDYWQLYASLKPKECLSTDLKYPPTSSLPLSVSGAMGGAPKL